MGGSGVPPFILSIDKDLKVYPSDIVGMEDALARKTSGDQKGRPMVVTGGKVEKMGVDPDKMDLRASHRFAEERFSAVTGIPAVALELGAGHEHSIYNNVKAADERSWEAYLLPLYTHMEDELNVQLLEDFEGESSERYCRFDISNVRALQEDEDAKAKRLALLYTSGGIKRSEFRSGMGYGPSDETRPEDDEIFFDPRGASLVQPGEDPLNTTGGAQQLKPIKSTEAASNGHGRT
jgi:phage portal protein BeeE